MSQCEPQVVTRLLPTSRRLERSLYWPGLKVTVLPLEPSPLPGTEAATLTGEPAGSVPAASVNTWIRW